MVARKEEDIYLTRPSLLERIKNGDDVSWQEFSDTYSRFIKSIARSYQVREADWDEVVTQVLEELFRTRERFQYDPNKGRFRDYLKRVVKHHILRVRRKNPLHEDIDDPAVPHPGEDEFSAIWDAEWKQHVIKQARMILASRTDSITYRIFTELTMEGSRPEDVAQKFNVKVDTAYSVKCKCLKLLRKYRSMLGDDTAVEEEQQES